ncbi:PSP1 family protein [Streptobacillus canis]|uniref:PSP1 family protein n=1 Tax=Streptobacillus canis TaxID=2678686 RepID=UPI0012E0FAA7|nr:PSP1 domain-containing protein [Streptobacillus canis]
MNIVNIRFRKTKKVYPFYIENVDEYKKGDYVIVETIRGNQIGVVLGENKLNNVNLETEEEDLKIRKVKRKLTEEEVKKLDELDEKAKEAYFICKKIVKRVLPEMNLVIGEYMFGGEKLIFYFTAEGRLDFRELVKEVNKAFNRRVEFYQIKYNDEGRILNSFGKYGREIYW